MIAITGDTHGEIDIGKLNTDNFRDQKTMTKEDKVIVCGDFGCIWYGDRRDAYWLDWLESKSFTTLFVDGNHENHDLLNTYPIVNYCGGKAHQIRPSVYHLMRGQVFDIDGTRFFTMGGARSTDKQYRKEGVSWWPQELPSEEEYQEALSNLDKCGWEVDVVLSHCAPDSIQTQLADWYEHDKLTNFLQTVKCDLEYKYWLFGHYHVDKWCSTKDIAIYDKMFWINL